MYRFHPRTRAVARWVRTGTLGRPAFVDAAFTFAVRDPANIRLSRELAGGALLDVGCYPVDVARTVLGARPVAVSAFARTDGPDGVDLETAGAIAFDTGAMATVRCALTLSRLERVEVRGADATVRYERAFLPGDGPTEASIERAGRAAEAHRFDGKDPYLAMVEAFAARVVGRRDPEAPASDAEEAAATVRILEALATSARDGGRRVSLDGEAG